MPFGSMKFLLAPIYLYYIINSQEIKKLNSTNSGETLSKTSDFILLALLIFGGGIQNSSKTNFHK